MGPPERCHDAARHRAGRIDVQLAAAVVQQRRSVHRVHDTHRSSRRQPGGEPHVGLREGHAVRDNGARERRERRQSSGRGRGAPVDQ